MRSAVITGATGAIGNALIRELISNGIEVLVLTKDGKTDRVFKSSLVSTKVCPMDSYHSFEFEKKYDVFFHLAWQGSYGKDRQNEEIQNANIKYSIDAVKLAKRLGCSSFVGVGSQAEYGNVNTRLSSDTQVNPVTLYGKAKLQAMQETKKISEELGIKFNWCRVLSTYGIGDKDYTLVMKTVRTLLDGEVMELTPCDQIWDYIYNEDVARALVLISEKGIKGKTYVLGSGDGRPLKEYVMDICEALRANSENIHFGAVDYYPDQVMYLCADISELAEDTSFVPKTDFKSGIKQLVDSMR